MECTLFTLLAPNTMLGPVAGSRIFGDKSFEILIPIFYKLSVLIISYRYSKVKFATKNLKIYFSKKFNDKSFNFSKNYIKKI